MIFEIAAGGINRWKVTESGPPELKDCIPEDDLEATLLRNLEEWSPENIFRAKAIGGILGPLQLDFFDAGLVPALTGFIHTKLDRLLRDTLQNATDVYKRCNGRDPRADQLFSLVFRFIAAKVLRDRGYPGGWDSNDAMLALRAVEDHYNEGSTLLPRSAIHRREVLDTIWRSLLSAFHFQNLSVDDLAFVYENTLITKETRKTWGTHSTPPEMAEYIVRKLPFEQLPEPERYVLEPCSGHGIFLVSAMRRLRELLPVSMSSAARHRYFVKRLVGIEIDGFAREVSYLSLMLADYPNPDGWKLYEEDVYASGRLEQELERATIVLSNGPFENFTDQSRADYGDSIRYVQKPAELLRRVVGCPPRLLGMVLPETFKSGSTYLSLHRQLARSYAEIELISLPEVFNYSSAPSVLLLAHQRKEENSQVSVTCCTVKRKTGLPLLKMGTESSCTSQALQVQEANRRFSLWIPTLSRVWTHLSDYDSLAPHAEIHKGIGPKDRTRTISDTPKLGYIPGFARAKGNLKQYYVSGRQFLSLRPEDQYDNGYRYDWHKPKVACNAVRLSRGPWRLASVADPEGMGFSDSFFGIWPSLDVSIYAVAAVLNSHVANAYSYDHDLDKHNHRSTLGSLPIPTPALLASGKTIDILSRELHLGIEEGTEAGAPVTVAVLASLLNRIDEEVLQAYDLPSRVKLEILDMFRGEKRALPFNPSQQISLPQVADQEPCEDAEQSARIIRYQELVDRKFITALTADERRELEALGKSIDGFYDSFYEEIFARIQTEAE